MIAMLDLIAMGDAWAQAMVCASIQGGIALAVAWILCRAFDRKLPAVVRCWVLRLVFAKTLLALVCWTSIPLPLLANPPTPAESIGETVTPATETIALTSAPVSAPTITNHDTTLIWMTIWGSGVLVMALSLSRSWQKTRRFRRSCRPLTDTALRASYEELAGKLRVRRAPELLTCPSIGTPMLVGLFRPAIVVPQPTLQTCHPNQIRLMLAHELAHFRRHDLWWAWLPTGCRAMLWFHPLVWLTGREWSVAQESACDEIAIAASGSTCTQYGQALLAAAAGMNSSSRLLAMGTCTSRSHLERRILAMRHVHHWTSRRFALAAVVLAFVGAVTLLPWRLAAQPQPVGAASTADVHFRDRVPVLSDIPFLGRLFMKQSTASQAGESARSGAAVSDTQPRPAESVPGLISTETVVVRAPHDGTLHRVTAREGDPVKAGQMLVEFVSGAEVADVAVQEAQYQKDKLDLQRVRKLQEMHAVAPEEVEERQATVQMDMARLEALQLKLRQNRLTSPITGVVSECRAHDGGFVRQGDPILTVISVTEPKVQFDVTGSVYAKIKTGDPVVFRSSIYPDPFKGKVVFISPAGDPRSSTFRIKAVLDDSGLQLRSGMSGEVQLPGK